MKKYLSVFFSAMMFCFAFTEISQAGQCVYLGSAGENSYYYDSSSVKYSGDIVSYNDYGNPLCEEDFLTPYVTEIDCVKKMYRSQDPDTGEWESWKSITVAGSPVDKARTLLCK